MLFRFFTLFYFSRSEKLILYYCSSYVYVYFHLNWTLDRRQNFSRIIRFLKRFFVSKINYSTKYYVFKIYILGMLQKLFPTNNRGTMWLRRSAIPFASVEGWSQALWCEEPQRKNVFGQWNFSPRRVSPSHPRLCMFFREENLGINPGQAIVKILAKRGHAPCP